MSHGSQSQQKQQKTYRKFSEAPPACVPLRAINVSVMKLPEHPDPFWHHSYDSLRRAIKPTSFLQLPAPITMRLYSQAFVDMFNITKNMGFASYKDSESKERVQLFFHGSDYRSPETLTQTPPPRYGAGRKRERVVQMAPMQYDDHDGAGFKPPSKRDQIYYVMGENARGPCIAQWTTVLEYNEHLDYVAERFNLDLKIVLDAPIYSLWIMRPKSLGIHCNQATKSYEERYEWQEERLEWVGNNLDCQVLCEIYTTAESMKPACQFRWQKHNASYNADTGEWLAVSVDECDSPIPVL